MNFSLKLLNQDESHHNKTHAPPLHLRAKIPISILNLPFQSHISTTTKNPSDLSLSISTAFPSFPSLKLSYAAAASSAVPPVTLTLKSGTGLFGSPKNSPLVIAAQFSLNPDKNSLNPNPRFSLHVKPKFGSFSVRKFISSDKGLSSVGGNVDEGFDSESNSDSYGFVPLDLDKGSSKIRDVRIGSKDSIFEGIGIGARTEMPVGKRLALGFRWLVDFPKEGGLVMSVLRINKIGVRRVYDDKTENKSEERNVGEVEVLKGMCFWMKNELDGLRSVNREIKRELEEVRVGSLVRKSGDGEGFREGFVRKKVGGGGERFSSGESGLSGTSGFEAWRSKRNGGKDESVGKEEKRNGCGSIASDVENELQRAIMAASAGSS